MATLKDIGNILIQVRKAVREGETDINKILRPEQVLLYNEYLQGEKEKKEKIENRLKNEADLKKGRIGLI